MINQIPCLALLSPLIWQINSHFLNEVQTQQLPTLFCCSCTLTTVLTAPSVFDWDSPEQNMVSFRNRDIFFNGVMIWTFMVHCSIPREARSVAMFLRSHWILMLNADQSHQVKKSNLQSLRKCPSHRGQYSHQLYLSLFCFPLLWYWEWWSFNTLSLSQLSEHCNYSIHSYNQQTKPINPKKRAVCCSRARSLEYFFMKTSGNVFLQGKRQKENKTKKNTLKLLTRKKKEKFK